MPNIPSLPPSGNTSWYSHYAALDDAVRQEGEIMRRLSDFAGANDDAKLTAALTYAAAQTYKPTILLDEAKQYSFSTKQPLFSGLSLRGSFAPHDQDRSGNPQANEISLSGVTGGWFYLNQANTYSVTMQGLTLNGGSGNRLVDGHASNVLWTSVFRDITAVNLGNVLGSEATKLLNTAITLDGFWNVNNIQERAWVLGGSDSRLAFSMALIDSPGDANQFPNADFLLEYSSQSKTPTRNLYITAEGNHSGIYIGSGSSEMITFSDCVIEGRNAGSPSDGRLVYVQGTNSIVTLRDCWLAYAMAAPPAGHDGVVEATSGKVLMDGCTYERATGVAESVPLFYASGGKHIIRNIRSIGFTGLPTVRQSVAGLIDADSSVTVVTG
jgi:hypothetical protein